MTLSQSKIIYDSYPERELENMWQQINEKDTANLSRSLLKAIAKKEEGVKTIEIPLYTKQMFNPETEEWIPFDIWGAHFIINNFNGPFEMRMRMPLPNQNEFGEILSGWKSYDTSYLQESLKDKKLNDKAIDNTPKNSISAQTQTELQYWLDLVRKEREAYKSNGMHSELPDNDKNS